MAQTYFASIQPGLETAVLDEIRRLGGNRPEELHGGVEFDVARKRMYRAHLQFRTATRIWMRVDEFRSRDAPELYNKTKRYDWQRFIGREHFLEVRAHSSDSRLYHTGKVQETVTDAIRDRFRDEIPGEGPPKLPDNHEDYDPDDRALVMARIVDDRCQLSLDASGELLHQRGWRTEAGEAPLRETVAAAMLELVDWSADDGLIDPMCGSGTIPVEAACRAVDRPPGLDRRFAFMNWRNFQPERFDKIAEELREAIREAAPAPIVGRDGDDDLVDVANRNADRAGVADHLDVATGRLDDLDVPDDIGWIVTNPPWGERLEESNIVQQLIETWRAQHDGCQLAFLWPKSQRGEVQHFADGRLGRLATFPNGGISVDLWSSTADSN